MNEPTLQERILEKSSKSAGSMEISKIYISPDRMREDNPSTRRYIDEDLAPSIVENGLIHPPVLNFPDEPIIDEVTGTEYHCELITGWCRTQACISLGLESIPYTTRNALTEHERLALELEENLMRKDMTWQEQAIGLRKAHRALVFSKASDGEKWGVKQTGKMLGMSHGRVSEILDLADRLVSGDEELYSQPNVSAAQKLVIARKEDAVVESLREAAMPSKPKKPLQTGGREGKGIDLAFVTEQTKSDPEIVVPKSIVDNYTIKLDEILFHMDNRTWFDQQAPESVDLIYTDIPYGIDMDNLDYHADDLDRVRDEHDVNENIGQMAGFLHNAFKVLKDGRYCLFWYDICHHEKLMNWAKEVGFTCQEWPLIWLKEHNCRNRAGGTWWTKKVEYCFVARKGVAKLNNMPISNVISANGEAERKLQRNPFAKPFAVSKWIFDSVATPGDLMVDCYAGEGSLIRAAINCGLKVKGIEKSNLHFPRLMEHVKRTYAEITRDKVEFV